jgi:two-component system, NarL family, nitrate/nitrite response regulator NarL
MNLVMEKIRLLVLGDDDLAGFLGHLLPRRGRVSVRGPVEPAEAIAAFEAEEADLAAVDLDLPGGEGIRWIELLKASSERSRAIGISRDDSADVSIGALVAGACGVVSRQLRVEEMLRSLHRAAAGELVIPERDLHHVVGRIRRSFPDVSEEARIASLTARETQILLALTEGLGTSEIAKRYGIRVMTVQSHVKSILAKLGVHSKVEAVTLAWRAGLAATRTA